jgi:hypothetical protein
MSPRPADPARLSCNRQLQRLNPESKKDFVKLKYIAIFIETNPESKKDFVKLKYIAIFIETYGNCKSEFFQQYVTGE